MFPRQPPPSPPNQTAKYKSLNDAAILQARSDSALCHNHGTVFVCASLCTFPPHSALHDESRVKSSSTPTDESTSLE
eukprot:3175720-Rhodomonas_salina.1